MGAGRPPATANQKASDALGEGEQRPQPRPARILGGEPPWGVSGVTCVLWDWLAPQREGSRLASEDGPIPRACGQAGTRQSSLSMRVCLWDWIRASVSWSIDCKRFVQGCGEK